MKEIEWTESLSLGVEAIDDQHKELIRIVNRLLHAIKDKDSEMIVNEILAGLREYTVFHFNAEEKFMEEIRYPHRGEHLQQHQDLKQKVKGFQYARFHHEEVTLGELKAMLSEWLLEHILDSDLRIAKFMREKEKEEKKQQSEDDQDES